LRLPYDAWAAAHVLRGFGNGHVTGVIASPGVSGYPPLRDIVSSVALTFFAFLGFGVITLTAKDLANPSRQLPQAGS
jgi:amino acid transporter